MDLPRYSRGHFWGTIIPGAFLIINVLILCPNLTKKIAGIEIDFSGDKFNLALSVSLFVFAYVLGIGLRLIDLNLLVKISLITKIPDIIFQGIKQKKLGETWKTNKKLHWQPFPYVQWFFGEYVKERSEHYKDFYEHLLKQEYKNDTKNLGKNFINYCKTFIYINSIELSEEVMYNEGLTRFMSGVIYSLIFAIVIVAFNIQEHVELFWIYISLLLIFLYRFHSIRIKEVLVILDGYFLVNQKIEHEKNIA